MPYQPSFFTKIKKEAIPKGITSPYAAYQRSPIHILQQPARLDNLILASMSIPVHGGADIRVPGNGLQCLDVQVRRRHRDICVPLWYIKDKPGKP